MAYGPDKDKQLYDSILKGFQAPQVPAGPSSFDVIPSSSTVRMNGNLPVTPPPPVASADMQPPAPEEAPAMPPMSKPSSLPAAAAAIDPKIVSSHPGLTPDEISTYLANQKGQLDKYGPDQEKMVMDSIAAKQHGLGHSIEKGGAALADGIMQGVARAGNSNFLSQMNATDQHETENALANNRELADTNMKTTAAKQGMDQMDPNSAMGRAMISTWGPLMDKIGIPKEKQASMMPALLSTMLPEEVKLKESEARIQAAKDARDLTMSTRQDQKDQDMWIKLGDKVNALNAGSRKALGIAASSNMRADRLLRTAMNPDSKPQDIMNMIADIQGIYKGGVPDEISLKHGTYNNLVQDLARINSYLSSRPQDAKSPEVIAHLVKVTKELKEIDNKVLSDNLGVNKVIFEPIIAKDPERWDALTGAVMGSTVGPGESNKPAQSAQPAAGEVTRKTKDGKIAVFDAETKQFLRYQ